MSSKVFYLANLDIDDLVFASLASEIHRQLDANGSETRQLKSNQSCICLSEEKSNALAIFVQRDKEGSKDRKFIRNQITKVAKIFINTKRVDTVFFFDCAISRESLASDLSTISEYIGAISEEIAPDAHCEILTLEYDLSHSSPFQTDVTNIDITNMSSSAFLGKVISHYVESIERLRKTSAEAMYPRQNLDSDKFVARIQSLCAELIPAEC